LVENRGVDQLVAVRFEAPLVTQATDGAAEWASVSDDTSSIVYISLPARDIVDIWKPIPLTIDMGAITLFDLATGATLGNSVSTTYRASTTSPAP
jgi:hypothetical protein